MVDPNAKTILLKVILPAILAMLAFFAFVILLRHCAKPRKDAEQGDMRAEERREKERSGGALAAPTSIQKPDPAWKVGAYRHYLARL
ncbi:hypothetical protein BU23DRAFT_549075 [Bimuria novae-zelandiae CBS 107.79]|uniref:Uncharacterized protein n=1 Tax=Bimuria novae-zelandiae CBS 107.79 TaxID=1447943 RepID=A0A6A5W350_9PLEO|nr:hypothetical protein BU23DRAFT_549075 [Bimuria novae-zelandiae CBS 107.79]